MKSLYLEDLGLELKTIESGSEFLFLYELSKYVTKYCKSTLNLGKIFIGKAVTESSYFQYVSRRGLVFHTACTTKLDIQDTERLFFESSLDSIELEEKTEEQWVYTYSKNVVANRVLNGYNRSAGYVSLIAKMIVLSYTLGKPVPKLILKNGTVQQEEREYLDLLILRDYGNKLLRGYFEIEYSSDVVVHPEWEAYISYNRQRGAMLEQTSKEVKLGYIRKKYVVGDVLLYYQLERNVKSNRLKRLESCYPCVIRDIGEDYLLLGYWTDVRTELTEREELEEVKRVMGEDFERLNYEGSKYVESLLRVEYDNVGIDQYFYSESVYFMSNFDSLDTFPQYVKEESEVKLVYFSTADTIYAVFEDREVDYNRGRFLSKIGHTPIYERYR